MHRSEMLSHQISAVIYPRTPLVRTTYLFVLFVADSLVTTSVRSRRVDLATAMRTRKPVSQISSIGHRSQIILPPVRGLRGDLTVLGPIALSFRADVDMRLVLCSPTWPWWV